MANDDIFKDELQAFEQRRQELVAQVEGQFALVHGDQIIGTYESQWDAIAEGYRRFGNVPFLVKQVTPVDIPASFVSNILAI